MSLYIDKNKGTIEWNTEQKTIVVHNKHVLYAFQHGKSMLMVKENYELSEDRFCAYDNNGKLIFSYKYRGNNIIFRENNIPITNGRIISADYEEEKGKLVVLKELQEMKSLLIYDDNGDFIAEIISPQGYTFVSLKNNTGNIMVVAQGTNDITRDSFGRNDWNFVIDFDHFYVQKKSITQNKVERSTFMV